MALAITAILLFVVANFLPLIGIEVGGRGQSIRLSSGVDGLANHGLVPLALFVLVISILAPVGRLLALAYVLLRLRGAARPRHLARTLRLAERMRPWSMLDVFLVGTLVALTKLQDLAAVDIGLGLWSLGLLVISLAAVDMTTDPGRLWDRIGPLPVPGSLPPPQGGAACLACGLLQEPASHCLRCHVQLQKRKPSGLSRAAALVLTGLVLYLPANLYPVLTVVSFGRSTSATIIGGVSELMNGSDWPLAIIVFTASIAVPLLKLVGLGWLLLSTRLRLRRRLADRTRLYRLIELVSRWSAVDIFVAALLTALVTLGNLATIEPGLGVLAFGAVVFVTMLATESFDTRLMWDAAGANDADRDPQHQALSEQHRLPLVWLVPIVAILAAAWLGYRTLTERGPVIAIMLQSADGIEAGKTKIRHKQVELGVVSDMEPSADLSMVTVHVQMNRYADGHLNVGTRFWVVRPRFSAEGISGLGTLISGAYMEMEPGPGTPTRHFTALEDPPVLTANTPGTEYVLHARRLGSIGLGAPISFHGIKVGEVLGTTLSDEDGSGLVRVFVRAPHDRLVHDGTRFWNASGLTVELGADGLRLQTESLQAILAGGITFDVPQGGEPGALASQLSTFTLYDDAEQARDALYTRKIRFLLHLSGSAQGLATGAAVRMRGIQIGEVTDVHMEYDAATKAISVPVMIEVEPQRVRILNSRSTASGFTRRSYAAFDEFVAAGLRAQLASGNLLTGQKIISLDFIKDAAKVAMIESGPVPEIPVVETDDLDAMIQSAKRLLASLSNTVASLNQIIVSPEVRQSLLSLDHSLQNIDHLTRQADLQAGPLLTGLRSLSTSADTTLKQATATLAVTGSAFGKDSGGGDLAGTLDELKQASRSLRALSDYLESHPGSLIRGKNAVDEP